MVIYGWLKVAYGIFCPGKLAGSIFQLAAYFDFYNVTRRSEKLRFQKKKKKKKERDFA